MPRDILTTMLQTTCADRMVADEQERFQRVIQAIIEDVPIPMCYHWMKHDACCVCASKDPSIALKYIWVEDDGSFRSGETRLIRICGICARALGVMEREREFETFGRKKKFIAWMN